jgi:hypothetical protein
MTLIMETTILTGETTIIGVITIITVVAGIHGTDLM